MIKPISFAIISVLLISCGTEVQIEKYPNGSVSAKYEYYIDDIGSYIKHGYYHTFWPNGQIKQKMTYADGKENGLHEEYWLNGKKALEQHFSYGELIPERGINMWYDSGRDLFSCIQEDDDRTFVYYKENGQMVMHYVLTKSPGIEKLQFKSIKAWDDSGQVLFAVLGNMVTILPNTNHECTVFILEDTIEHKGKEYNSGAIGGISRKAQSIIDFLTFKQGDDRMFIEGAGAMMYVSAREGVSGSALLIKCGYFNIYSNGPDEEIQKYAPVYTKRDVEYEKAKEEERKRLAKEKQERIRIERDRQREKDRQDRIQREKERKQRIAQQEILKIKQERLEAEEKLRRLRMKNDEMEERQRKERELAEAQRREEDKLREEDRLREEEKEEREIVREITKAIPEHKPKPMSEFDRLRAEGVKIVQRTDNYYVLTYPDGVESHVIKGRGWDDEKWEAYIKEKDEEQRREAKDRKIARDKADWERQKRELERKIESKQKHDYRVVGRFGGIRP